MPATLPSDATTSAPSAPAGDSSIAKIPINTENHNVELAPAEIDSPDAFDMNEITADKSVDHSAKLPGNTGKPKTTNKPQKFESDKLPAEEASEETNGGEPADDEAAEADEEPAIREPGVKEADDNKDEPKVESAADPKKVNRTNLPPNRDYSGFDEEDVRVLKKCRNEQYGEVSGLIKKYKARAAELPTLQTKVKELENTLTSNGVPPSWYDHPEAFTLTPEFNNLQSKAEKLSTEQAYIQEQLVNVEEGKPFSLIRGYDSQGNLVFGPPQEATSAGKIHLMSLLQKYAAAENGVREKAAGLAATFRQSHTHAAKSVISEVDKHINNMHADVKPSADDMKLFKDVIPAAFRDHPMTEVCAKMWGVVIAQARANAKYKAAEVKAAKINNDVKEAGANTRTLPKNGVAPGRVNGGFTKLANGKMVPAVFDMAEITGDNS